MYMHSQQAARVVPREFLRADLANPSAPPSEAFRRLGALAKELDLALAAEVGLEGGTLPDGGLTCLVLEAGQTRESLHRVLDETMRRYEMRQHNALRQHMMYVSEVLQRRVVASGRSPKRSPRQEPLPACRKVSPRFSSRSPRKVDGSARREKGNKMIRGPHSDRSASAIVLTQRDSVADYQKRVREFSSGDASGCEGPTASFLESPTRASVAVPTSPLESGRGSVAAEGVPLRPPAHGRSLKDEICKEVRDVLQAGMQQLVQAQARANDSQAKLQADVEHSTRTQEEMSHALQVLATQQGQQQLQLQGRRPASPFTCDRTGSVSCDAGAKLETGGDPSRSSDDTAIYKRIVSFSEDKVGNDWRKWVYARHSHPILQRLDAKVDRLPAGHLKRVGEWVLNTVEYIIDVEEPPRIGRLASCVSSTQFELLCVSIIICNMAFTISVLELDMWYLRGGRSRDHGWHIVLIEGSFMLWYVIEISMKLKVHKRYFFTGKDALWNAFDTGLVFLSVVDLAIVVSSQMRAVSDVPVELRILRITKLGRILRALKAVRFLEDLRVMLELVVASITSIFWAVLMIGIAVGMFSLLFMEGVIDHLREFPAELPLFQHFESVPTCMLTLLLSVTGGIDWIEPYVTMTKLSNFYPAMFVLYILFFVLVLFNIVTSVFLDRVMKFAEVSVDTLVDEKGRLEASDIRQLERMFRKVDVDSSGSISLEEFKKCVGTKQFGTFLAARGIDIKEATAFFELLSQRSEAGEVRVMDVVQSCARLKGNASSIDLQILRHEIKSRYRHIQDLLQSLVASANVYLPPVSEGLQAPQTQSPPTNPFEEREASPEGN